MKISKELEERVVRELKECGKPFAIILNSKNPDSDEARELALELEKKYNAPVALVNCLELDKEDIGHILELVLMEFPVCEIRVKLPPFIATLEESHKRAERSKWMLSLLAPFLLVLLADALYLYVWCGYLEPLLKG